MQAVEGREIEGERGESLWPGLVVGTGTDALALLDHGWTDEKKEQNREEMFRMLLFKLFPPGGALSRARFHRCNTIRKTVTTAPTAACFKMSDTLIENLIKYSPARSSGSSNSGNKNLNVDESNKILSTHWQVPERPKRFTEDLSFAGRCFYGFQWIRAKCWKTRNIGEKSCFAN